MKRFSGEEIKQYWEKRSAYLGDIDYEKDLDGLNNVCHAGASLIFNKYYANFQKTVYLKLLSKIPDPKINECLKYKAIDIGCGAGRWCRLLTSQGYETTGIDLQYDLIENNKNHYPNIKFFCSSIQDLSHEKLFDLASSVTVIQHIPFDEQDIAIEKIKCLLNPNGYVILLENINDQGPHVFSHTVEKWITKFRKAGFSCLAMQRYDYSPFIRTFRKVWATIRPKENISLSLDEVYSFQVKKSNKNPAKVIAAFADYFVEPFLIKGNFNFSTVHCGFLFKKTL